MKHETFGYLEIFDFEIFDFVFFYLLFSDLA